VGVLDIYRVARVGRTQMTKTMMPNVAKVARLQVGDGVVVMV